MDGKNPESDSLFALAPPAFPTRQSKTCFRLFMTGAKILVPTSPPGPLGDRECPRLQPHRN